MSSQQETAFVWSEALEETLINLVEPVPSLWDKRNPLYSRQDLNARHWQKIGAFIGCTGENASHKFGLLKRRYVRHKNKEVKSGAAATHGKEFFLGEKMQFLNSALSRRVTADSLRCATQSVGSPKNVALTLSPFSISPASSSISKPFLPPNPEPSRSTTASPQLSPPISPPLNISSPDPSSRLSGDIARPVQASRMRSRMLAEVTEAFVSVNEAANILTERYTHVNLPQTPVAPRTSLQRSYLDFMSNVMDTLTEAQQQRLMDMSLEAYLQIRRE